jgi:hypothetical protein
MYYSTTGSDGEVTVEASVTTETIAVVTSSQVGLSEGDKITLGTSLGIGIPGLLATVIGVYFAYHRMQRKYRV